jgi:hypothetical protein
MWAHIARVVFNLFYRISFILGSEVLNYPMRIERLERKGGGEGGDVAQLKRPRLEGRPNTAARLAGGRRVTQQGMILYVMDGPCRLP